MKTKRFIKDLIAIVLILFALPFTAVAFIASLVVMALNGGWNMASEFLDFLKYD